ncbi:MAG: hypothetical protein J7D61_16905 [Marichromatium sp.]|nr:hypothetical protein [Marichromatium sp.]
MDKAGATPNATAPCPPVGCRLMDINAPPLPHDRMLDLDISLSVKKDVAGARLGPRAALTRKTLIKKLMMY